MKQNPAGVNGGLQILKIQRFWKLPAETLALRLYFLFDIIRNIFIAYSFKLIDTKKSFLQYFHGDKIVLQRKFDGTGS